MYWMGPGKIGALIDLIIPAGRFENAGIVLFLGILQLMLVIFLHALFALTRPFECLFRYRFSWDYVAPYGVLTPLASAAGMLVVLHVHLFLHLGLRQHSPNVSLLTPNFPHAPMGVWWFMAALLLIQCVQMIQARRNLPQPHDDGVTAIYSGLSILSWWCGRSSAYPHSPLNHFIQLVIEPGLLFGAYWFAQSDLFQEPFHSIGFYTDRYSLNFMLLAAAGMAFIKATQYRYFLFRVWRAQKQVRARQQRGRRV